jgi:uncharacterized protein (DUF2249 family)
MKIHEKTKISELIKHNREAIDSIASLNSHFKKLQNPILRSVMAPRITIEEAARIGKCSIEDFFSVLQKIGFQREVDNSLAQNNEMKNDEEKEENQEQFSIRFDTLTNNREIKELDVRETIRSGQDPFVQINTLVNALKHNEGLLIINSFEPIPLIRILEKKGFVSATKLIDNVYHTLFVRENENTIREHTDNTFLKENIFTVDEIHFEEIKDSFKDNILSIDVREMEMPLPMLTILEEIEKLDGENMLHVFHKKIPHYLLNELKERDVVCHILEKETGNIELIIHK